MNYQKVIENLEIFRNKPIKVKRLKGGVTNANFKVIDGSKKYVAKFGFKSNKYLGLNRKREIYNYKVLVGSEIAPQIVKFYPTHDMLLLEYIEGKVLSSASVKNPEIIAQIGRILRKVHKGPKFKGRQDPFLLSKYYFKLLKGSWIPLEARNLLEDLEKLRPLLGKLKLNVPCHLDVFPFNIVIHQNKMKLLDWEYSAMSDYRIDLASVSVMARFEPEQDITLIKSYGNKNLDLIQFNAAKAVAMIREIGWDLVQVKYSKLKFNYKKYTMDNISRYNKALKYLKRHAGFKTAY